MFKCLTTAYNSDSILAGNMRNDLIQNVESENVELTATNFVIENNFVLTPGYRPDISNLRLLLVYDKNSNNFIPVVDDLGKFTGIVTRKDIIRYYAGKQQSLVQPSLRKIV